MIETSEKRLHLLDLTALFVEKNKMFAEAIKQKRPFEQLKTLHSELQEIYNHISFLRHGES